MVPAIDRMFLAALCSVVVAGCDALFTADGKVVNAAGRPVAGIAVSAYDDSLRVTARTDENGCFHLSCICSPFKHKVPIRVGDPNSAPVDTVDGPTMSLRVLITVPEDNVGATAKVTTGATIGQCAPK
jgi:hypothetical protein